MSALQIESVTTIKLPVEIPAGFLYNVACHQKKKTELYRDETCRGCTPIHDREEQQ